MCKFTEHLIYVAALFLILVSCDLSNPRENSSIDDFIDSDELTTILEIKIDLDDKIIDALNTGMTIHLLKRSLLEGEIDQFYKFIKIDPEKVSQMKMIISPLLTNCLKNTHNL